MIDTAETQRGRAILNGMTPYPGAVPDRIVELLGSYDLQVTRLLEAADVQHRERTSLLDQLKQLAAVAVQAAMTPPPQGEHMTPATKQDLARLADMVARGAWAETARFADELRAAEEPDWINDAPPLVAVGALSALPQEGKA